MIFLYILLQLLHLLNRLHHHHHHHHHHYHYHYNNNNLYTHDKGIFLIRKLYNSYQSFSPSSDIHSNLTDWLNNGSHNVNDPRPDSATSSVLSRDSGVARSDPKSSRDFSAKSESSSKASINNNNTSNSNHLMPNNYSSTLMRNGLSLLSSSNTTQRLLQHQHQQQHATSNFDTTAEQIREKLQPLNTQRLKTLRQATKSFIVS